MKNKPTTEASAGLARRSVLAGLATAVSTAAIAATAVQAASASLPDDARHIRELCARWRATRDQLDAINKRLVALEEMHRDDPDPPAVIDELELEWERGLDDRDALHDAILAAPVTTLAGYKQKVDVALEQAKVSDVVSENWTLCELMLQLLQDARGLA